MLFHKKLAIALLSLSLPVCLTYATPLQTDINIPSAGLSMVNQARFIKPLQSMGSPNLPNFLAIMAGL